MAGETEAREGKAALSGLHSSWVLEPGWRAARLPASALVCLSAAASLVRPLKEGSQGKGFEVKGLPEELNVSYGSNSRALGKISCA